MAKRKESVYKLVYDPEVDSFKTLVFSKGFKNISAFARATGIDTANLNSNLSRGKQPSLDRLFLYANTLHIPLTDVLLLFFPTEMKKNTEISSSQIPAHIIANANKPPKSDETASDDGVEELEHPDDVYLKDLSKEAQQETPVEATSEDSDINSRLERMESMLATLVAQGENKSKQFASTIGQTPEVPIEPVRKKSVSDEIESLDKKKDWKPVNDPKLTVTEQRVKNTIDNIEEVVDNIFDEILVPEK